MAELSDFLPSSGGTAYLGDFFSGTSITYNETLITSTNTTAVNVAGKGILYINVSATSTTLNLVVDGISITGDRFEVSRALGSTEFEQFAVPFKASVQAGATLSTGSVTFGVST